MAAEKLIAETNQRVTVAQRQHLHGALAGLALGLAPNPQLAPHIVGQYAELLTELPTEVRRRFPFPPHTDIQPRAMVSVLRVAPPDSPKTHHDPYHVIVHRLSRSLPNPSDKPPLNVARWTLAYAVAGRAGETPTEEDHTLTASLTQSTTYQLPTDFYTKSTGRKMPDAELIMDMAYGDALRLPVVTSRAFTWPHEISISEAVNLTRHIGTLANKPQTPPLPPTAHA